MRRISVFLLAFISVCTMRAQEFNWAGRVAGTGYDQGIALAIDGAGNVVLAGNFSGSADVDPGPGVQQAQSVGETDMYVAKLSANGTLLWAVHFGGAEYDNVTGLAVDNEGNVLVSGYFEETVDFDPGAGTFPLTSNGNADGYILKLNSSGSFVWAAQAGGGALDIARNVTTDDDGNVLVCGEFRQTVDFDPGGSSANQTSNGGPDAFLWKLDAAGNFVWVKSFGGDGNDDIIYEAKVDAEGNIVAGGTFQSVVDFDPGPGQHTFTSQGSDDMFLLKLTSNGDLIWANQIGGIGFDVCNAITLDPEGNVYYTGYFQSTVDFDPGAGNLNLTTTGSRDIFISRINKDGSIGWAGAVSGPSIAKSGVSISADAQGNVFTTGYFAQNADFDSSPGGINQLGSAGFDDLFLCKLRNDGSFVWAYSMGGAGSEIGNAVRVGSAGQIYLSGNYEGTVDFDPTAGIAALSNDGLTDAFILKITEDECSGLSLGIQSVTDVNCMDFQGRASAKARGGVPPYSYSWATTPVVNDTVIIPVSSGIYFATATDSIGCSRTTGAFVNGTDYPDDFDLQTHFLETRFRPGFASWLHIIADNMGCEKTDATLRVVLSPDVDYSTADPLPDEVIEDTLIWHLEQINWDSEQFKAAIRVVTNFTVSVGDSLCFETIITPVTGDVDTTNNYNAICYITVASFDPNNKVVNPKGACQQGYVLPNETMGYLINFQNIGTAEAENVVILDTLSASLDLNTFRVIGASHRMITEVLPGPVLRFRFDGINLPDSASDEAGSQGYVLLKMQALNSIADNTGISNRAAIYFDFNEPVITNYVLNTIVSTIPECTIGMNLPSDPNEVLIFPNPASEYFFVRCSPLPLHIEIVDTMGRLVKKFDQAPAMEHFMSTAGMREGIYFVKVQQGKNLKVLRLAVGT